MTAAGRAAAILVLTFAAVPAPGSAQEMPTPDELVTRANVATAFERRPENEREQWTVRADGLDGTLVTLRRNGDHASTTTLGPFRTARGKARGVRWQQNENGETVLDRPEPSQTERIANQSVTRAHEPLDAWVVTTNYTSGHAMRSFYDARTAYLVRTERTIAGRTKRTTYEDFRADGRGHIRPWHYFGGDDRPENAYDYRLVRDDISGSVTEAEVAVPRDRRTLVEFPAGLETVRLPARIENDRIYVRLEIMGRGLDFLLDTGSAALTIDESVLRALGIPVRGRATQTVAGSFATGRAIVPAVSIGALTMRDVVFRTVPFASNEARSTRVVGLLGFDFLASCGIRIDYARGTVDAQRPGTLEPPPGIVGLDVRLNAGTPVARATVGTATGDDFIIDTGAAFSYVLFQRFARAHPEAATLSGDGRVRSGTGVGGSLSFRSVTTKRITLGAWSFDDAVGVEALSPFALGFDNEDGLIGADILKLFTVYLDYAANRMYLAPNGRMATVEATSATRRDVSPIGR
ncbi:MAG: hypothetical protein NVS2B8_03800 [Vulcanimicrobiaceae bacterium]